TMSQIDDPKVAAGDDDRDPAEVTPPGAINGSGRRDRTAAPPSSRAEGAKGARGATVTEGTVTADDEPVWADSAATTTGPAVTDPGAEGGLAPEARGPADLELDDDEVGDDGYDAFWGEDADLVDDGAAAPPARQKSRHQKRK